MPLDANILTEQLLALGDPKNQAFFGPGTLLQAPQRLCAAYDAYAKQGVDAGGNPLISGNAQAMREALAAVFAVPAQSAAAAAQGLGVAHQAYWAGATFVPGTPPAAPGVGGTGIFSVVVSSVVVLAPAEALTLALSGFFLAPSLEAAQRAHAIAQAWHAATLTVAITMTGLDTTPPPVGPLPVVLQATLR